MAVPTRITDLSATASSNSPAGSDTVGTTWDDYLRVAFQIIRGDLATKGSDIASAATTDLGAVQGLSHDITGTTTITSFGTVAAGVWKIIKFEGALTLTYNATSLILPGAANITTADGDVAIVESEGSGNWRCVSYFPASGSLPFVDSSAVVIGSSDKTKKVRFEVDGLTTATTRVLTVQDSDDTIVGRATTDTLTNKTITGTTNVVGAGVLSTEQATTSGTSIDFTGIPSWVKRITIMFIDLSTNGTSIPMVQIGDSGGIETAGYTGAGTLGASSTLFTTGFGLAGTWGASVVITGRIELTLEDSANNEWVAAVVGARTDSADDIGGAGHKATSATLDRVRLTTVNGTDTFDAGAINILYS